MPEGLGEPGANLSSIAAPEFVLMRRFLLLTVSLATFLCAVPGGAAPAPKPGAAPPATGSPRFADAGYSAVLQAYRGELTEEQIEALGERDPAPALYLSPKNPGERAATRFFASLPDDAHDQLQKTGYLKWRVDRLPKEQRGWVREAVRTLEARREGPFPLTGKEPAFTGFARIRVEGLEQPQYCWWVAADGVPPAWFTLVRALGLLTQEYAKSYQEQLPTVVAQPESEAIPAGRWLKVREIPQKPKREPEPTAPALVDEKYYWSVVRAYRGQLGKEEQRLLTDEDPLLGSRLRSKDPATRNLNELFAKLTEEEHRTLLTTGRLVWGETDLSKPQRKLVDAVLRDLNERTGGGMDLYLLSAALATRTGFALVQVPGAANPVISWWVSTPSVPHPAWVPLTNDAAVKSPGYYRAHLEQLPGS